jgi:hypothetical protein
MMNLLHFGQGRGGELKRPRRIFKDALFALGPRGPRRGFRDWFQWGPQPRQSAPQARVRKWPCLEFGKIRHKVSAITQSDMIADIFVNRNILF